PLWMIGSGGHAKVVVATARAAGFEVVGLIDDRAERRGTDVMGVRIVGDESALPRGATAVIAIGDNAVRERLVAELTHVEWATVVHPRALLAEDTRVGAGSVVFAMAVVQPGGVVGDHAIVNTAAVVEHDVILADYSQAATGAVLTGGASLGRGSFLGAGATVLPGIHVGDWSKVGAGAVVTRDVPARVTVMGVPARIG